MAAAVSPADPVHGIPGSRQRQHVSERASHCEAVSRRRDQLGTRGWKDADLSSVGFVATSVHRPRASRLASRDFPERRHAIRQRGDRVYRADYSEGLVLFQRGVALSTTGHAAGVATAMLLAAL